MNDPTPATKSAPSVIFELTGPYAGESLRIGGFEFHQGEIHVAAAEADRIEAALGNAGIPLRRKRAAARKRKPK